MRTVNKLKEILNGWTNLALDELDLLDEDIKQEGERRAEICNSCPMRTGNTCDPNKVLPAIKDFVYNSEPRFKGKIYRGCGCPLKPKVLSTKSQCPIGNF